jgi:hypothetical protein
VHRHLVMFASLFLCLWAAISIGCSSKKAEESRDSTSAPSSKSASLFRPKEVTLPAGTALTVRLASTVGSKTNSTGDHFNATIATPVESGGKVVLPKCAEVLGKVVEAVPEGSFKGAAELRLVLETVTLNNDSYDVQTSSVGCYLKGQGKRTATLIGTALGTGAGTAGAAYTREDEIVLPAESALSFKLTEPLTVKM